MSVLPQEGELVQYLRSINTSGPTPAVLSALDAYASGAQTFVVKYHRDYEAALEAGAIAKINAVVAGAVSSAFTYGGSIDISSLAAAMDGESYAVDSLMPSGDNKLDIGRYYRIVCTDSNHRNIKVSATDVLYVTVKAGDAVVIRENGATDPVSKTFDKFDNTDPALTGSETVSAVQGPDGNYTLELTASAATVLNSVSDIAQVKEDINTTFAEVFDRLDTFKQFMLFIEDTGILVNASGAAVTFSNDLGILAKPWTPVISNSGIITFPEV